MKTGQTPDKNLLTVIVVLIIFGLIMSFSASLGYFNSFSYFIKQGLFILIGLILGFGALKIPLSFYKKHSKIFFIIALVTLILVFLPDPIGKEVNGSRRWISLVYFNFQPSEMMKLIMILFMAGFLVRQEKDLRHPWLGFIKSLIIVGVPSFLLLLEPDIGATMIVIITAFTMLFAAGVYLKQLGIVASIIIVIIATIITQIPNRVERLVSFWSGDLWLNTSEKVYQTKQALIGIARGDWGGTGLGAGIQKYNLLPERHTDMIFAVIGEELGIFGMLFVLFSFTYIILKGFGIAKEALKNGKKYSSYVSFGISTWLAMQIGVNIAMNLALIPPKGFTLPLISYGGSSMIFAIIALAIILRIDMENRAKYNHQKQYV